MVKASVKRHLQLCTLCSGNGRIAWRETLCQHPADCTAKQTHVSHRHGGEGEGRKLCIPEGLCLGPGGFATLAGPGVTDWQYESINHAVYHAEEVTCGEASSFLRLVKSSLTCTECLLLGEAGITASGTTTPPIAQSCLGEQAGWAPGDGQQWLSSVLASHPSAHPAALSLP